MTIQFLTNTVSFGNKVQNKTITENKETEKEVTEEKSQNAVTDTINSEDKATEKKDVKPADAAELAGRITVLASGKRNNIDGRNKDLSKETIEDKDLEDACIDTTTVLSPEQTKKVFPVMENAKKPGLGINTLHEKGITGKGVRIAVIDEPLFMHSSYANTVKSYSENGFDNSTKGTDRSAGVVSILTGKTTGVAPDSEVVYFAANDEENGVKTNKYYTESLNKIIENNENLPENKKVSVVTLSKKLDTEAADYEDFKKAAAKAKEAGIFVVSRNMPDIYEGFDFYGANRKPEGDVNNVNNYFIAPDYAEKIKNSAENLVGIPSEHRTVADTKSFSSMRYEGNDGGKGWAAPWFAGMFALAKQVKSDLTPEEFLTLVKDTSSQLAGEENFKIINPVEIVDSLETLTKYEQKFGKKN